MLFKRRTSVRVSTPFVKFEVSGYNPRDAEHLVSLLFETESRLCIESAGAVPTVEQGTSTSDFSKSGVTNATGVESEGGNVES